MRHRIRKKRWATAQSAFRTPKRGVSRRNNVTKFVSYKDRKLLCAGMRPIYTAPTVEAAELALDRFAQSWELRYPASVAAWRNHWNELTTFFKYPVRTAPHDLHHQCHRKLAFANVQEYRQSQSLPQR